MDGLEGNILYGQDWRALGEHDVREQTVERLWHLLSVIYAYIYNYLFFDNVGMNAQFSVTISHTKSFIIS